jgi:hypothetical protein
MNKEGVDTEEEWSPYESGLNKRPAGSQIQY